MAVKAHAILKAYVDRIFLYKIVCSIGCPVVRHRNSICYYGEVIDNALWKLETAGFKCRWPTGSVHTYVLERQSDEYLKGVMQIFVPFCTANSRMRPYLQDSSGKN
jgi:hypothetical protein